MKVSGRLLTFCKSLRLTKNGQGMLVRVILKEHAVEEYTVSL